MQSMLFEPVEYKIDETVWGTWRSFLSPTGRSYREFASHMAILGLPMIHYTSGICPETGRRKVAKGVIAIGRFAMGVLAIGHVSVGLVAIGQVGLGILLGLGQLTTGTVAVGQAAIGVVFGLGQVATGYVAIGQMALGWYVLAQGGVGKYVWDMGRAAPAAEQFYRSLIPWLRQAEAVQ